MRTLSLTILLVLCIYGCVQKTYTRTVVYKLTVPSTDSVTTVSIKGKDEPLSWDEGKPLEKIDSNVYQTMVTYKTGYLFTEVKFVVNGNFELENQPNRVVNFSKSDTTFYNAVFGVNGN